MSAARNARILRIIPILIAICLASLPAQAQYAGGTGEPNDPYLIHTAQQMNTIGLHKEDWGKHFRLMADIDVSAYAGRSFNMIGDYASPFKGVFDGNGHTISNFKISRSSNPIGMFGCLNDPNALIKNLGLINPIIQETYRSSIGSIVGSLRAGTISSCYAKGGSISVSSSSANYVGGLVGENSGTVSDCNSIANVSGAYGIGGIVGKNNAHITNCWSGGGITATYGGVGGIAGDNYGTIIECYATGTMSSSYTGGGVAGLNRPDATISNCYSHGVISGQQYIGGLVGGNAGGIVKCYSVSTVNGKIDVGGLVGRNHGRIVTCYSVGPVRGSKDVGGLVGIDDKGQVLSSFWDMETSGQTTSGGGWGKTTAEMQTAVTFVDWGRNPVWTIDEGKDYPRLAWQNMPGQLITTLYGGGDGTLANPYLIYTPEQFDAISNDANDWDKHFKLMADLDLTGISVHPISYWAQTEQDKPFSGVFDGNGKSITNFISPVVSSGLFDYVSGIHAEIKNLTLIDPNINGVFVGPLVGCLEQGTVKNCSVVSGNISGNSYVGGLIGFVQYGIVENCYSNADVTGRDNIGGLVGMCRDDAIVMNCRATGSVHGTTSVGGLVGLCLHNAIIINCGATGTVSGTKYSIGGLVGDCPGGAVIAGSSATGDVSGQSQIGGLVGSLEYSWVVSCYATGSASGAAVGGLVGKMYDSYIADSYSIGQVIGSGGSIGGFSGYNGATPEYDCFWNVETSGQTSSSGTGAKGLNTLKMQDPNTFIDAGWDFVGESRNGPSDIWIMPDGGGYPILSWQTSPLPPLPSFSGGTGEPSDPFIISTPQELNSIGHNPRLMATHFKLANDIDLTGVSFFLIGSEGFPFMGVFDGDGYKIINFSYEASNKYRQNVGLFKYVRGLDAEIRNLVLTNSNVINQIETSPWDTSRPNNIGCLVGLLYEGIVFNCHVEDGQVTVKMTIGGDGTGGLIGYNMYGIVEECSSTASVQGESGTGGLLGCNRAGFVIHSHSGGNVVGDYSVGGLVGSNWALIGACSTSGSVSGYQDIGGLVGWNVNAILECCSYADVAGRDQYVGGLVGTNLGHIENSYARATVSGKDSVGGLVGDNTYVPRVAGSVVTCYSTGSVTGNTNVGGLLHRGDTAATTTDDCFWDIQTSGQTTSDGGIGKTTAEMQTASTFLDAGWDFAGETANGTEDIWWILERKDYPRLWWEQ